MTSLQLAELRAVRQLVASWQSTDGLDYDVAVAVAAALAGIPLRADKEDQRRSARSDRDFQSSRRFAHGPSVPAPAMAVLRGRSGGYCEAQTPACPSERHAANHPHHLAGRRGEDPHRLDNLLHVCWLAHGYIHDHPAESYAAGWMVKRNGVQS